MLNKKEEIHQLCLPCTCSTEILRLCQYLDEEEIYLSIHSLKINVSFWEKLKHCWKILTTGQPYGDQVVLSNEAVKALSQFIAVKSTGVQSL
jgi:hypothetical protein